MQKRGLVGRSRGTDPKPRALWTQDPYLLRPTYSLITPALPTHPSSPPGKQVRPGAWAARGPALGALLLSRVAAAFVAGRPHPALSSQRSLSGKSVLSLGFQSGLFKTG